MNKTIGSLFLLCAGAIAVFPYSNAFALPTAGMTVEVTNGPYGNTSGGEFTVNPIDGGILPNYIAFCLELSESVTPGSRYTVKSVSDYAEKGGTGAVGDKDDLDDKTKWLYFNYMFGNHEWSRGRAVDQAGDDLLADNVQNVIWHIEMEQILTSGSAFNFYKNVVLGVQDYSISGTVKSLNIMNGSTYAQSLIIGEQNPVPEPATLFLMGSGLLGLLGVAKRKKNHSQEF